MLVGDVVNITKIEVIYRVSHNDNLSRAKGVKDLNVSLEKQTVEIKYDSAKTSEEVLKTTIEKLGYPVSGKLEPGHEHHHGHDHGHDHGHNH
mgnify:CR=1 FL=1